MKNPSVAVARRLGGTVLFCFSLGAAFFGRSPTAIADSYDAPTGYYTAATGTGETLKSSLYQIIAKAAVVNSKGVITTPGFSYVNYGNSRYYLGTLYADPDNAGQQFSFYSGNDVTATWDATSTYGGSWNREHIATEDSLGIKVTNTYSGYGSDMFELAPTIASENNLRSNDGYGYTGATGTPSLTTYGTITGTDGNKYFYAGDKFKGDAARTLFYMATRYGYYQSTNASKGVNTSDSKNDFVVTLANGEPNTSGQMGDLNTLLHWAYEDPVDTLERRKNSLIYNGLTGTDGNTYKQGNRNPYIDHPEYIWAVFGTTANTSTLSVATPATNGSSSTTVNVGRVIAGTAFNTGTATITKTNASSTLTPTTFDVTQSGSATSSLTGTGEAFTYDTGSKAMTVGLTTATAAGAVNGTITVNDTDLTSAGAGQGSADGDDVVTVTGTAVDHSNASFTAGSDNNTLTLALGTFTKGTGVHTATFNVVNLLSSSGYTAALDLDSITGTGSTTALFTNLATFSNETAGTSNSFLADLDTTTAGSFSATYTLAVSDENIPGATAGTSLTLNLSGTVLAPEPAGLSMLLIVGAGVLRRRKR